MNFRQITEALKEGVGLYLRRFIFYSKKLLGIKNKEALRNYLEPGKFYLILDAGCGNASPDIFDLITGNYKFWAVDINPSEIELLCNKIKQHYPEGLTKIARMNGDYYNSIASYSMFDALIYSNILHFDRSLKEIQEYFQNVIPQIKSGTIIKIKVHSKRHPAMGSEDDTFEHFFSMEELKGIFTNEKFEVLFQKEVFKPKSRTQLRRTKQRNIQYRKLNFPTESKRVKNIQVADYLKKNGVYAYLVYIIRKK